MFHEIKEITPVKFSDSGKRPLTSRLKRASLYASIIALSLGAFGSRTLTSELLMGSVLAAKMPPYTPAVKHVTCDLPSKEMVFTQNMLKDFGKTMPTIPDVGSPESAYQEVDGLLDDLYGYRDANNTILNKPMMDLLKKWVRGKTTIEENKRINFGLLQSDIINTKTTSFSTKTPPTVEEWASLWGAWGTPQFPEEIDKLNQSKGTLASPEQNSRALAELRAIKSIECPSGSGESSSTPGVTTSIEEGGVCTPKDDKGQVKMDANGNPLTGHWKKKAAPVEMTK